MDGLPLFPDRLRQFTRAEFEVRVKAYWLDTACAWQWASFYSDPRFVA